MYPRATCQVLNEHTPHLLGLTVEMAGDPARIDGPLCDLRSSLLVALPPGAMMSVAARTRWEEQYTTLADSLVAEVVRADLVGLRAVPETLQGVMRLAGMKQGFETTFGSLKGLPSVEGGREQYQQTRTRILTAALPQWQQEVDRLPLEAPPIAAKHQELDGVFPNRDDRTGVFYTQYAAPLRAMEDQLRTIIADQQRKEDERRAALTTPAPQPAAASTSTTTPRAGAARGDASGPLSMSQFTAKGLANEPRCSGSTVATSSTSTSTATTWCLAASSSNT